MSHMSFPDIPWNPEARNDRNVENTGFSMRVFARVASTRFRGNDKEIIKQGKAIGHYFYMLQ